MPFTELKPSYQITLTGQEYRLVTMALAGIIKDSADLESAKQLNTHLCHQRLHHLKESVEVADKAFQQAQKLSADKPVKE